MLSRARSQAFGTVFRVPLACLPFSNHKIFQRSLVSSRLALNRRCFAAGATDEQDVVIIGGGPGGYVAAIKAAQLGLKVASISTLPMLISL
jgi:heterodisulfide reductase subunit A-like polyferredoxin